MDLEAGQEAFRKLIEEDLDNDKLGDFFRWIQFSYLVSNCRGSRPAEAHGKLRDIASDLRSLVPKTAIMPSEKIITPKSGDNSDCDPKHTIHVDGFLYDQSEIDELVEEGKLQNHFCKDCGSHNTAPLTYVTHSASRDRLDFIFSTLLPWIEGKTILDVGSRLGAMLYGGYLYTAASSIIGVEINPDLCKIQNEMIEKHNFSDRIRVICDDVRNVKEELQNADVVILNNVFEFFLPEEEQISCWKFLKKNIKKGTILVTIPSLENSLKNLNCGINIKKWVKKRPIKNPLDAMCAQDLFAQDEMSEAVTYDVIG